MMTAKRSRVGESRARQVDPRTAAIPAILILVLFGWLAATPAQAQIGTPVDLGSNESLTATAGAPPPLSVTTTASVPAGASIIVIAVSRRQSSGDGQVTSAVCSDSAGNTYNTDVSQNEGAFSLTTICSTHGLAAQLPQGSTITITWSGGHGTQLGRVHAFSVTGLATTPLDGTVSGAGTSSSPSTGTVTTTQANELLFGAIMSEGDSASVAGFTPGSGYTTLGGVGSTFPSLFGEYRIVSATGNYAANGTLGTINPFWHALLATYKAAPVMGPSFDACLKDDSTGNLLQWNSTTGQYKFTRCSDGFMLSGTGAVRIQGSTITLVDFRLDRRVLATVDNTQKKGKAAVQYFPLATTFTIMDRNTGQNTCSCL